MTTRKIEVPAAPEGSTGGTVVSVHFPDQPGAMRRYREWIDQLRNEGFRVEVRMIERKFPIADVYPPGDGKPEWELSIFGPRFERDPEPGKEKPVVEQMIAARIALDDADELDKAVEEVPGLDESTEGSVG